MIDQKTSAMPGNEEKEYAIARSNIYKLLSLAFSKELTQEAIEIFRSASLAETLKDLCQGFGEEFYNSDKKELLEELSGEYAALFILSGGVNPTESVARSGLYMQPYAGKVLRFYKQCGFALSDDFHGFHDHIGVELEFMSHLSQNEAAARNNGAEDDVKKWIGYQKKFLEDHLSKWAIDFAKNVAIYAEHSFYREMAKVLYEFIRLEAAEFSIEMEDL